MSVCVCACKISMKKNVYCGIYTTKTTTTTNDTSARHNTITSNKQLAFSMPTNNAFFRFFFDVNAIHTYIFVCLFVRLQVDFYICVDESFVVFIIRE